jgi:hypothetical protein
MSILAGVTNIFFRDSGSFIKALAIELERVLGAVVYYRQTLSQGFQLQNCEVRFYNSSFR